MIRPVEDRPNPGEYVNRVKHTEHDHAPGSRDFAYEIGEVTDEQQKKREHPHEFGEDTYEHSDTEPESPGEARTGGPDHNPEPSADDNSLDITV
jgi:hypothetical protein